MYSIGRKVGPERLSLITTVVAVRTIGTFYIPVKPF